MLDWRHAINGAVYSVQMKSIVLALFDDFYADHKLGEILLKSKNVFWLADKLERSYWFEGVVGVSNF